MFRPDPLPGRDIGLTPVAPGGTSVPVHLRLEDAGPNFRRARDEGAEEEG